MSCEQCTEGMIVTVDAQGNRSAKDCECRAVLKFEGALRRCGLPPRYQQASFETFESAGRDRSIFAGKLAAEKYVLQYIGNEGAGLLFTGPVGVGKTHLAISILRELTLRYSARTYFTDFRDLLKRMQETFDSRVGPTRADVLRPVLEADCLVIDELGAARVTDWTYEVAEEIINARYNSARSTIFTTNLNNHEAGWAPTRGSRAEYGQAVAAMRPETLGDRLGARMYSRLQEMCAPIEMQGEDYRPIARSKRA